MYITIYYHMFTIYCHELSNVTIYYHLVPPYSSRRLEFWLTVMTGHMEVLNIYCPANLFNSLR